MCTGSHSHVRPAPQELETSGARIGQIDIDVEDIFDTSNPKEDWAPYRLANRLHINTQDEAVRSQLLLQPEDLLATEDRGNGASAARAPLYLRCVDRAGLLPRGHETVDMLVRVRDVWSLNPGVSFSRKGGANGASAEVEDQDFLGTGKLLLVVTATSIARRRARLYEDPQLFGSWWRGRFAYSDNSDGPDGRSPSAARSIRSIRAGARERSGCPASVTSRATSSVHIADEFAVREQHFDLSGGVSTGLRDGWTRRWLAGLRYDSSEFTPTEDLVAGLPEDRRLVYPWIGVEWIENDFGTVHNFNQIGRTEDVQFGAALRAELGLATPTSGQRPQCGDARTGQAKQAFRFGEMIRCSVGAQGSGRLEFSDGLRDAVLQSEARYYHRQSRARAALRGRARRHHRESGSRSPALLGGDNGLRGYPLRYQSGQSSLLLTAEQRLYTDWYPFRLFNVGAAVFADAGRTWGPDFAGQQPLGWLGDAGVGLRIGNARSGLGNVLHIDLAVPLVRQPDIDSVQLLIETRGSF